MGSKGSTTQNYERELSAQELQLLETQNRMMDRGIAVAEQQESRAADQYSNWQNTYQPIETGIMPAGATRENGYYGGGTRNTLFQNPREQGRSEAEKLAQQERIRKQMPYNAQSRDTPDPIEKDEDSRYNIVTGRR